jgi:branched-chain amino acid transport system ATP-binding protein
VLKIGNLNVHYGKSHVVFDLSLEVGAGEVLALLGRNGAGKTTTITAIVGLLPGARGQVSIDGRDVGRWPAYRRSQAGIAYVPSGARCFPNLTATGRKRGSMSSSPSSASSRPTRRAASPAASARCWPSAGP